MKKQLIISLVLVLGLTTIAQPSFAMKRSRPGSTADQFSSAISSIVLAARWFLANQPEALEYDNPYSFRPNHITFVSHSGTHFNVVANDLDAFLRLSRSISTVISDLAGTDMSTIPLPVHDSALYLLTEIASGADNEALLNYIRRLTDGDIEDLKKDAELLDSQALKDLISRALYNPFETLTNDVASLIFAQIGPQARTHCREVNRAFKRGVDLVRLPSGSRCTDKLPILTTIQVYAQAWMPVLHGQMLYVVNYREGMVYVFDTKNAHQLVATIFVGLNPLPIVIHGKMLYVSNHAGGTVSVIDTSTNKVVATIKVGTHPLPPFVRDEMLYVENLGNGTFSQIDPNSYKVAATYPCFRPIRRPLDGRQMLYSVNVVDGTIKVFAPDLFAQLAIVHVFNGPRGSVVHGRIGYVANAELGTVSVIDQNTFQVMGIIEVGGEPHQLAVHGQLLYVMDRNNGTVTVIDIGGYLPGQY